MTLNEPYDERQKQTNRQTDGWQTKWRRQLKHGVIFPFIIDSAASVLKSLLLTTKRLIHSFLALFIGPASAAPTTVAAAAAAAPM